MTLFFKPVLPLISAEELTPSRTYDLYQYMVEDLEMFPALKGLTPEQIVFNPETSRIQRTDTNSTFAEAGWILLSSTNGTYHVTDNPRVLKGFLPSGLPQELFYPDELTQVPL